jgi:hypothetical protein
VFRTFQGWTALSEMRPDDGGLHVVPIPSAIAYVMVRDLARDLGLLDEPDEPPDDWSSMGGGPGVADEVLRPALVPIPAVEPGDTVWWHGDLIHSVADAANDIRWSNVMYIGVAPGCERNDRYVPTMFERFERGASPIDFPAEDVEVDFVGRAGPADLDAVGRRQFGLGAEPVRPA